MNFEAWQSQQRAQKEEERKRKTDAAATLHQYRGAGMSEADRQLAAAKEAERRRKLAAERMMHEYRGAGMSEADARLAAQKELERQQKINAERGLHGYRGAASPTRAKDNAEATLYPELVSPTKDDPSKSINPGAVSSMMGMFSGSGVPNVAETAQSSSEAQINGNRSEINGEDGAINESIDARLQNIDMHTMQMDQRTEYAPPSQLLQPEDVPPPQPPQPEIAQPSQSLQTEDISPFEPQQPENLPPSQPLQSEYASPPQIQPQQPEHAPPSQPMETGEVSAPTPEPMPSAPTVPVTENIAFQIGILLPHSLQPSSMDPYVATTARLVQNLMSQDDALYNTVATAYPVVQGVLKDEAYVDPGYRAGVTKYRVTMSIAITSSSADARNNARQKIIAAIRQGIQSGEFQRSSQ